MPYDTPVPGDIPASSTAVLANTLLVEDPFGNWFSHTNCAVNATAWYTTYGWMEWGIVMQQSSGWQIVMSYSEDPPLSGDYIDEFFPGVGDQVETGGWSVNHVVPEPGDASIVVLGLLMVWKRGKHNISMRQA